MLSTRRRYSKRWARELRQSLGLGSRVEIRVLGLTPPNRLLPVSRFYVTDPSNLPYRPCVEAPVRRRRTPPVSLRDRAATAVRGVRNTYLTLVGSDVRDKASHHFAVACGTSRLPKELAQWADVAVAMDDKATLGAVRLAHRVPETPFAFRPGLARRVLQIRGVQLPEIPETPRRVMTQEQVEIAPMPMIADEPIRLLIAPANFAGQAHAWAQVVNQRVQGAAAHNFKNSHAPIHYDNDLAVDESVFATNLQWRRDWRRHVKSSYTHVLIEAGFPIFGLGQSRAIDHARELQASGLRVAMLAHGSDVRIPSIHAANEQWAPYDAMPPELVRAMEIRAQGVVAEMATLEGQCFVSTPGLLEFVPQAVVLPTTISVDRWRSDEPVMHRTVPVVAFAPTSVQKGPQHIDPVLTKLESEGLITYRRVEKVPVAEMPEVYGTADIVVDQIGVADYGVAACEAMAAGRVVVSHVAASVRESVQRTTGHELPIVQADPLSLEAVIRSLLHDREVARAAAAAGPAFVSEVHDGRASAAVLEPWLRS